jgi:hypothetical protein
MSQKDWEIQIKKNLLDIEHGKYFKVLARNLPTLGGG